MAESINCELFCGFVLSMALSKVYILYLTQLILRVEWGEERRCLASLKFEVTPGCDLKIFY